MTKLEKAKEIIAEHIEEADCGIFDSRNIVGDEMETLYDDNELTIDICYGWYYYEVFGLTKEEFKELENYYESIRRL